MKFSPKCRVLCLELKSGRMQLKKGRGAAGEGKRGGYIGPAGALTGVILLLLTHMSVLAPDKVLFQPKFG